MNEYQAAQQRVDKELSAERKKEQERLDKALKARKAAIKAKNEAKLRELHKDIDKNAQEVNARSKDGQMQIQNALSNEGFQTAVDLQA